MGSGGGDKGMAAEEEKKPLAVGDSVQISGLKAKPKYNGKYGEIQEGPLESGRFRVKVPDPALVNVFEILDLKPDNLEQKKKPSLKQFGFGGMFGGGSGGMPAWAVNSDDVNAGKAEKPEINK